MHREYASLAQHAQYDLRKNHLSLIIISQSVDEFKLLHYCSHCEAANLPLAVKPPNFSSWLEYLTELEARSIPPLGLRKSHAITVGKVFEIVDPYNRKLIRRAEVSIRKSTDSEYRNLASACLVERIAAVSSTFADREGGTMFRSGAIRRLDSILLRLLGRCGLRRPSSRWMVCQQCAST